jgi:chromodomain-helicase-DNA-binding protein 7
VQSSGKFVLLRKLLPKLKADGHRVLIFSQFTKVLDLMSDILETEGWRFERLDGSVSGTERQRAIDRFSDKNSDSFIFILSTRAGGVGINLTAADTVIVFDPDWNPQNDVQAMARVHRIGQTKTVQIYKLCTKGTYENHMLKLANQKLGLEHAVMRTGEHTNRELTATGFAKQDRTHDVGTLLTTLLTTNTYHYTYQYTYHYTYLAGPHARRRDRGTAREPG